MFRTLFTAVALLFTGIPVLATFRGETGKIGFTANSSGTWRPIRWPA